MLEVIIGSGDLMKEIDRRLKVIDYVIRHLVVRVDEDEQVVERRRSKRTECRGGVALREACRPNVSRVKDSAASSTTSAMRTMMTGLAVRRTCDERQKKFGAAVVAAGRLLRDSRGRTAQRRPMFRRRKVCKFCAEKIDDINYKDTKLLMLVRARARKDCPAPDFRNLRDASAKAADRDHARASARDDSVYERIDGFGFRL